MPPKRHFSKHPGEVCYAALDATTACGQPRLLRLQYTDEQASSRASKVGTRVYGARVHEDTHQMQLERGRSEVRDPRWNAARN